MGDWSSKNRTQLRGFGPTPMTGLKRKLAKAFTIYDVDEYNTSKYCNRSKDLCKKLQLIIETPTEENKKKYSKHKPLKINADGTSIIEIHSILTYPMENNRTGCINRDVNAVLNIKEIADSILFGSPMHPIFLRKGANNNASTSSSSS